VPTVKPIRARDLGREIRATLAEDTELCRQICLELAVRGVARAVIATDREDLVALGQYKRSWDHGLIPNGAEFGNDAPHSAVLEHGRRPGRPGPPVQPIFEWVQRKLFDAYNPVEDEAEAERLAWAIRTKLHHEGMRGRFILLETTEALKQDIKPAMVRVLRRRHA